MSGNLRLYNSGGYVELQAPSNATSQTLVLPTDSIQPALVHITTQSFSTVSGIALDNVFSNEYNNYRVMISGVQSVGSGMYLRLRSGSSDITASNYFGQRITGVGTTVAAAGDDNQTYILAKVSWGTGGNLTVLDFSNPYSSTSWTNINGQTSYNNNALYMMSGAYKANTSADGFNFYCAGSNTISGSISVYGYRNS